jgi:ribosomal protein L13E
MVTDEDSSARRHVKTRARVAELLEAGLAQSEIARRLGIAKSTVAYHARRLGRPADMRCNRRYDWAMIQKYYDAGHTVAECRAGFGFSTASWYDARKRGAIKARPTGMSVDELLSRRRNRNHLKQRLVAAGLKENRCEICGIDQWRRRPLSLCLHHVNGDGHDNRLENLQFLCPNCHSQTENFAGRNKRLRVAV